jgi:hypothetical protein
VARPRKSKLDPCRPLIESWLDEDRERWREPSLGTLGDTLPLWFPGLTLANGASQAAPAHARARALRKGPRPASKVQAKRSHPPCVRQATTVVWRRFCRARPGRDGRGIGRLVDQQSSSLKSAGSAAAAACCLPVPVRQSCS